MKRLLLSVTDRRVVYETSDHGGEPRAPCIIQRRRVKAPSNPMCLPSWPRRRGAGPDDSAKLILGQCALSASEASSRVSLLARVVGPAVPVPVPVPVSVRVPVPVPVSVAARLLGRLCPAAGLTSRAPVSCTCIHRHKAGHQNLLKASISESGRSRALS